MKVRDVGTHLLYSLLSMPRSSCEGDGRGQPAVVVVGEGKEGWTHAQTRYTVGRWRGARVSSRPRQGGNGEEEGALGADDCGRGREVSAYTDGRGQEGGRTHS